MNIRFFILTCFIGLSSILHVCRSFSLNKSSYYNHKIIKRQQGQDCIGFQCKTTRECIDSDKICDGTGDCKDGSDEFEALCKDIPCPGYLFKCDYGACIGSDQKCDGVKDCKDNSDEENCPTENKINSNCRSDQFECDNGQCIEIDGKCDGVADCSDRSDESQTLCLNVYCPGYTYKCDYGACVNGDAKCNGVRECMDNSDEDEKLCGQPITDKPVVTTSTSLPPVTGGCLGPEQPTNGKWVMFNDNSQGVEGQRLSINTVIIFKCSEGYRLSTSTSRDQEVVLCTGQGWSLTEMPQCQKVCPPIYSTQTTTFKCTDSISGSIIPCDKATDGTKLTFSCAPYYEVPLGATLTRRCYNGEWNQVKPECIQACGNKRVTATPLIVNGKEVVRGDYPWVVAIYSNFKLTSYINICGGSLLKQNLVLTAAHCIADEYGKPREASYYIVAAGKYYNKYKDSRDLDTAQYLEVSKIVVNPQYRADIQNFIGDMAVLVLKEKFALSKVVQPVCFHDVGNMHIGYNTVGVVTGWGYTEAGGKPSDVLKELELPYKDPSQCQAELPVEWVDRYLTYDKVCAGFYNQNTSVCKGDSGGGFAFLNSETRKYFVIGIVSLGHTVTKNTCNIQQSALFTNVVSHLDWLELQETLYGNR